MRLTFLTGIWPPDIGGPATHGPEFARFLVSRGHEVVVVTMGDGEPTVRPCEVVVVRRSRPFPVRYSSVAAVAARRARHVERALRDRHLRRRSSSIRCGPPPARRQARLRPGLREGAALRAVRRLTRGVSAARRQAGRVTQGGADPRASPRPGDRRPERLPCADRWRVGPRRGQDHGAPQPRPGDRIDHDADCDRGRSCSSAG